MTYDEIMRMRAESDAAPFEVKALAKASGGKMVECQDKEKRQDEWRECRAK